MLSIQSIAQQLPDLPRWVEARSLLLSGDCQIFGFQNEAELSGIVCDSDTEAVFVIGAPATSIVRIAVEQNMDCEVIAPMEQAAWLADVLPEWTSTRIIVYGLGDIQSLPEAPAGMVGDFDMTTLDRISIDEELREELESGAEESVILATFVEQQPVSFCYAGAVTETLWDIAIDTLPEHRRKGYAALCVSQMIRHMLTQGKRPVWQAVEENPASWRLAEKLGFTPTDELVLFEPREHADVRHLEEPV